MSKCILEGPDIAQSVVEKPFQESVKKSKFVPRIVHVSHYFHVRFIHVREPIFEYSAYYSFDRSIALLANEQEELRKNFPTDMEDVDLPPNGD